MKERGMIFNAEMVRAIIDGRKTQTRRIVKGVPGSHNFHGWVMSSTCAKDEGKACWAVGKSPLLNQPIRMHCPFGDVGDRIWVRETCRAVELESGLDVVSYDAGGQEIPIKAHPLDAGLWVDLYRYRGGEGKTVPSIHMPRWASRITLEITGVRVERLNDISHEDAGREGIHTEVWDQTVVARNYAAEDEFFQFWSESMPHYVEMNELFRVSFHSLWQSIYGEESWQANPWVWVIEFKRIEGGAA